jgi:hypothetical protein
VLSIVIVVAAGPALLVSASPSATPRWRNLEGVWLPAPIRARFVGPVRTGPTARERARGLLATAVVTVTAIAAIAATTSPAATPATGASGASGATGATGTTGTTGTSGPVAAIGSVAITRAQFDHWVTVANDAGQTTTGKVAPAVPVPPDFTACIASLRSDPAQAGATDAALKQLCSGRYATLVSEVMSFLIQGIWVEGEANARNVSVTRAQIDASYAAQRRTSKPSLKTPAELNDFLAKTGQTRPDLKWRTRLNLLATGLEAKVAKAAKRVSAAQISAYYAAHRSSFHGQSLQAASGHIRALIVNAQTVAADTKLQKRFSTVWRGRTVCLSGLNTSPECSSAAAKVAANPAAGYPGTIVSPPSTPQTLVWTPASG